MGAVMSVSLSSSISGGKHVCNASAAADILFVYMCTDVLVGMQD